MAEDEVKPVAVFCFPAVKNPDIMPLWFCFCVRLFARPFHHFSCLIYTLQVQAFFFFSRVGRVNLLLIPLPFGIPNGNHGCFCMLFLNLLDFSTSNHIVAHCNSEE